MGDGYTLMGTLAKMKPDHYLVAAAQGRKPDGATGALPASEGALGDQEKRAIASCMVRSADSDESRAAMERMMKALGLN